jgi:hypothetical protein
VLGRVVFLLQSFGECLKGYDTLEGWVSKSRCLNSAVGRVLVKHIWRILELDWKVEVSHTYREANRCADTLDNIGCSADYETMMYDVCPSHLSDLLAADCTGLSTPKLITV